MADVVNATRMELTRLKNQLVTTRRGHHLLKDKQDEMMRQFLLQIENYKQLRRKVDLAWLQALDTFSYAKSFHFEEELKEKFLIPSNSLTFEFGKQSVMSVDVPRVKILSTEDPKITYSFHGTHPSLDAVVSKLGKLLPDLIQMAVEDKKNRILIREIEKTKRRVNAIEHIIIPEIVDDIKIVRMKISDAERSNTVRIMKSKELILKKNYQK